MTNEFDFSATQFCKQFFFFFWLVIVAVYHVFLLPFTAQWKLSSQLASFSSESIIISTNPISFKACLGLWLYSFGVLFVL